METIKLSTNQITSWVTSDVLLICDPIYKTRWGTEYVSGDS